ncbi:hypothetical protein HA466_0045390 [Hirschfeldia incana]|nr:hypothetical protein HA466_0045390 [Hirschfeldia incana]KAJ0261412.1 hypothetical protein HA466_0045390 [Hirschfeldia incana]
MLTRPPNYMPNKSPESTSTASSATLFKDLCPVLGEEIFALTTLTELSHRHGTVEACHAPRKIRSLIQSVVAKFRLFLYIFEQSGERS